MTHWRQDKCLHRHLFLSGGDGHRQNDRPSADRADGKPLEECWPSHHCSNDQNGGGRGIRTPGELSPTLVFKTSALNRSAIPPKSGVLRWQYCSNGTCRKGSM